MIVSAELRAALVGANGAETIRTNPGRRVSIYFDDAAQGLALYDILTQAMAEPETPLSTPLPSGSIER